MISLKHSMTVILKLIWFGSNLRENYSYGSKFKIPMQVTTDLST